MKNTTYLIDIPPPTISGDLHIGHAMSYSHMDFMARYKAMKGCDTLYPFCFDNNGLPTEKLGQKHGLRHPQEIIEMSLERGQEYKDRFAQLGMAFGPEEYNTHSPIAEEICRLSFEDLKAKGLLYKAETEYYYCPKFKTSISQSEMTPDGRYERSGEIAILKRGEGYFIRMMDQTDRIREAIDSIEWKPDFYRERLHRWLDGLQYDWSISRERSYGIQIPGETGMTFDTWFISSLSPQLAWASRTGKASLECPIFDDRFQAHDIIRTWALFTITKSIMHNGQIPWKRIISGSSTERRRTGFPARSPTGSSSRSSASPDSGSPRPILLLSACWPISPPGSSTTTGRSIWPRS